MSQIYNANFAAASGTAWLSFVDSIGPYGMAAFPSSIEAGTVTLDANGVPQIFGGTPAGVLVSGFSLGAGGPANVFSIVFNALNTTSDNGGGIFFNYDAATKTGYLLNVEPLSGAIKLYHFTYVSGTDFTFTQVASGAFSFASSTNYLGTLSYNAGVITVGFGGTANIISYTDSVSTGSLLGFRMSATSSTPTFFHLENVQVYNTATVTSTFYADNANIGYVGNGRVQGVGAASYRLALTTGDKAIMNLAGTQTCTLNFNVSNNGSGTFDYPDVVVILDGVVTRYSLTVLGSIVLTFPIISGVNTSTYFKHKLEVIVEGQNQGSNAGGGLTTGTTAWTNNQGDCFFAGVTLDAGASLLPVTLPADYIEFDGDSISATQNMLGAGNAQPKYQGAHIGWPYQTAAALGLAPVMRGMPGNGLVKTSGGAGSSHIITWNSTPLANLAFPYVASGIAYVPNKAPAVVVVEFGTNDSGQSVSTAAFQAALQTYLATIRAAYPLALIAVMVLPGASTYASVSAAAVTAMSDANMECLNYSALSYDTTDGTHLNVGGAVTLAETLAADLRTFINARGLKLQIASGGGGGGAGAGVVNPFVRIAS